MKMGRAKRPLVVMTALAWIALVAWIDRDVQAGVPLALLYLFPVALASTVLRRFEVALLAVLCTAVAEFADAFAWNVRQGVARDALYFAAYAAIGLYISEVLSKRRTEDLHVREMTEEIEARRSAEEQLQLLVASSSIGIITLDESGTVLQANEAAERLFAGDDTERRLTGAGLAEFLPSLSRVPIDRHGRRHLRTMMQCQGVRANREPFLADVWFSTYETGRGDRMTAMVVDSSDELRDREQANLEQMLNGTRLLVGAVSHEIRNVCAAIGLVQSNLAVRTPALEDKEDFQALRQLTSALERMASVELSQVKRQATQLDLGSFFRDLQIIVAPALRESGVAVTWELAGGMPSAWADHQSLLQVFLNLIRNSQKALESTPSPCLRICAASDGLVVKIRVMDNGPGVSQPEILFRPFEKRSEKVGFGLYLSRAMMNSFHGDLHYEPSAAGAVFLLELIAVEDRSGARVTAMADRA